MAFLKLTKSHHCSQLLIKVSVKNEIYLQSARTLTNRSQPIDQQQRRNNSISLTNVVKQKWDPLDTSFTNPEAAFKSKTTWEVFRAYLVYQLCSSSYLVDNNMKLMKICKNVFGEKLFALIMKLTFYGHFVAGEDQYRIVPTLKRLRSFGVKPILDYSVEEDLSQEEAEKREVESSLSEVQKLEKKTAQSEEQKVGGSLPQYHVDKNFADRRYKVQSARTYFYLNEATCERNVEVFQDCLHAVAGATYGTGITAIKLTALGRPQLLLQLSEVIMRARSLASELMGGKGNVIGQDLTLEELEKRLFEAGIKDTKKFLEKVTKDSQGVIHLFPWSGLLDENSELSDSFRVPCLKEGRMVRLLSQLSKKEEEMFRNMVHRLNTLVQTARDLDVRLMVDAEQTYFQPAISRLTLELMQKYNTEKAIVFNTYQCYLKETLNEVKTDLNQAERQKFYFGAKLVRGAYIDQERARAAALGYADPTNPSYEATTQMYHNTLTECLTRIKDLKDKGKSPNKIGIMVASHNEDTVRFAISKCLLH
ncbi:proline dehydrogenase 1, mitochondrial-like isoform X2 [Daktulosphaira vitifoliae]|uniref:proline dehydrogenase 1, mitochondrial-like isoform X2 n=1 Tax=Daktulosphaira vitifoliae TaxID=58002 RepID=UPI0021AA3F4B|nr:proline dehydrogenase 1, mitochondrial-like isoform X2 [Daktulosphaira vitifoliae]